jgi:hypothetical protein
MDALWARSPYRKGRVAHWYRPHDRGLYRAICGIPSPVPHGRFANEDTPEWVPHCPQCEREIAKRRHKSYARGELFPLDNQTAQQ